MTLKQLVQEEIKDLRKILKEDGDFAVDLMDVPVGVRDEGGLPAPRHHLGSFDCESALGDDLLVHPVNIIRAPHREGRLERLPPTRLNVATVIGGIVHHLPGADGEADARTSELDVVAKVLDDLEAQDLRVEPLHLCDGVGEYRDQPNLALHAPDQV